MTFRLLLSFSVLRCSARLWGGGATVNNFKPVLHKRNNSKVCKVCKVNLALTAAFFDPQVRYFPSLSPNFPRPSPSSLRALFTFLVFSHFMARAQRCAGDVIAIFLFSMRPIIAHGLLKLKNTKSEERRMNSFPCNSLQWYPDLRFVGTYTRAIFGSYRNS